MKRTKKREHRPVTREETTDLALLPQRFEQFVVEMRLAVELLGEKILPALNKFSEAMQDATLRIDQLERFRVEHEHRLTELEKKAG